MLRGRVVTVLCLGALMCALAPAAASAQATGQISGRVTDTTGGVLPGVDVTLTRIDTGAARPSVTTLSGAAVDVGAGAIGGTMTTGCST